MFHNLSFFNIYFCSFCFVLCLFVFGDFFPFYALFCCLFNWPECVFVYCYWIGLWYLSRTRRRTPGWGIQHAFWNSYPYTTHQNMRFYPSFLRTELLFLRLERQKQFHNLNLDNTNPYPILCWNPGFAAAHILQQLILYEKAPPSLLSL